MEARGFIHVSFTKKHLNSNSGVNVVIAAVPGRCPAANNTAKIILAAANTLAGISFSFLKNSFEIMSTSKDMKNSLIMTSSITPPTSSPAMIFGNPEDILYTSFTQLLNEPNISLSPGNKHNAAMIVIPLLAGQRFYQIGILSINRLS